MWYLIAPLLAVFGAMLLMASLCVVLSILRGCYEEFK